MLITQNSILTGKLNTMELDITSADYNRYKFGRENVQNVFPHLLPEEREFIKTGITPEEWNKTFN
jgi:hypothetical protein|tara:strand:+ start:349 stop:543 length:195 start_codon:yes stop_codon:yes gene_type:complete